MLGPYSNEEIIVWSTGSAGEPNCIDPEVFRDEDGKLWLVYGSFFAGIYIKELDSAGLPVESGVHDYGKLLWKGGGSGVEGPFIFYNPDTDYYYLMVSDGSLSTDYNMRVARSKNPDGPYLDGEGRDTASAYGYGNKLAGNYQFGEDSVGYAALGHNSVIAADGKYLVVCHTRYRDGENVTTNHNLRIRQLFFNSDGWATLSPNRYAGESLGKVVDGDFVGRYDLILHSEGNDAQFVPSARYVFEEGGAVLMKSQTVGKWEITGDYYIEITLGGELYKGVIAPAWCEYGDVGILCFSAVSASGRSLWGNRATTDSDYAVAGLKILRTVDGDASGTAIEKFDTANGFAVSFRLFNATSDWQSATVSTAGKYEIHLPNLDAYNSTGALAGANVHPNGAMLNGHAWNTFLDTECYVTVSVSGEAVEYYKNGMIVRRYAKGDPINRPSGGVDVWSAYPENVGTFIELLFADISESGFIFAEQITAYDLILSEAVTENQASALYLLSL